MRTIVADRVTHLSHVHQAVTLPMWAAKLMGVVIERIGPKGLEYGRFSIDSHFTRNYLYVHRNYPEKLDEALLRPGRIDCMIHFKPFSVDLIIEYIQKFFNPIDNFSSIETYIKEQRDELDYKHTPSKLFELCVNCDGNLEKLKELL